MLYVRLHSGIAHCNEGDASRLFQLQERSLSDFGRWLGERRSMTRQHIVGC